MATIYVVADSPEEAVNSVPKVGSTWNGEHVRAVWYEASEVPRGFFGWLFRRPQMWQLNVTFEITKDSVNPTTP